MRRLALLSALALLLSAPASWAGHGVTNHASTGPADTNGPYDVFSEDISEDGSRVVFETGQPLVPEDQDTWNDIYEYGNTGVRLVSTGSSDGPFVDLKAISADGTHVFFIAAHSLVPGDTDSREDLYERHGNVTSLVSTGDVGGNGDHSVCTGCPFRTTPDGSHVLFYTPERLASADTDADKVDLYERTGGVTSLVSTGPDDGPLQGNVCDVTGWCGVAVSDDGTEVAFQSFVDHVQSASDTGPYPGLYKRANGTSTTRLPLASDHSAYLARISRDGSRVWFQSDEILDPGQEFDFCEDSSESPVPCWDVFEYSAGTVKLVSDATGQASFAGASPDGTRVFFRTGCAYGWLEPCTYRLEVRHAGVDSLIADDAELVGVSDDGARVFLVTPQSLVPQDTDGDCDHGWGPEGCYDVYEKSGGAFTLISTGPAGSAASADAHGIWASPDGARVAFLTSEPLVAEDTDSNQDIYTRAGGATTLLSHGPGGGNGAYDAFGQEVSADITRAAFRTRERLSPTDTDDALDLYLAGPAQPGGYPRPKGATPLFAALVPAYAACTAPNRTHGPPLAFGSCSPPQPASSHLTVGGSGGASPAKASGYVRIDVQLGVPGPPDTADAALTVHAMNVMRSSDLSDYTGELRATSDLRMTDRDQGAPSTVQDFTLGVTVPCSATADPTVGATCTVQTSFDSLVPGLAPEGMRAVQGLGRLRVLDGGPDEDADTAGDNSPFMAQGLFVP